MTLIAKPPSQELVDLVASLGGHWDGYRAMCRCPAHQDTTPSLSLRQGDRGILVNCFAGCANEDVLRELRYVRTTGGHPMPEARPTGTANVEKIWNEAGPVRGTLAERYLARRGLPPDLTDLRFHPRCPHHPKPHTVYKPALLVAAREGNNLVAIQRIFLDPETAWYTEKVTLGRLRAGVWQGGGYSSTIGLAAFQHFIGENGDLDAVAKRFGVTRKFVEGRLRLADLAEPIFNALAEGKITLDMAKAYATTPSHDRQLTVWNSYKNYNYNSDAIRRVILNETMKSTEPVAILVGADRYVAAGGVIESDLFSDTGDSWVNREIAEGIAAKIMEEEAARLGAELGLGWVRPIASSSTWEVARELHRVTLPSEPMTEAHRARIDEIDARLEAIETEMEDEELSEEAFSVLEKQAEALQEERNDLHNRPKILPDELKPRVGRILSLKQTGEMLLEAEYYSETPLRVTPIVEAPERGHGDHGEDVDEGAFSEAEDGDEGEGRITGWQIEEGQSGRSGGGTSAGPVKPIAAAPDGKALSQVLFDQLAVQRRDVLGAALLGNPALALDFMLFAMVDERGSYSMGQSGTTIKASRPDDPVRGDAVPPSKARDYINEFAEAMEDGWRDGDTKVDRFEAFRLLSDEAKAQWMAWVVATSLTAKDCYGLADSNPLQNRLASILEVDVASWWRPTSINYFDRISKGAILSLLDEVGGPALSGRHATQKKSEISESCQKLFAGEAIIEAEVREVVTRWVAPEAAAPPRSVSGSASLHLRPTVAAETTMH